MTQVWTAPEQKSHHATSLSRLQGYDNVVDHKFATADLSYLLSQYYYGEEFAVSTARLLLSQSGPMSTVMSVQFQELLSEEMSHALSFRDYLSANMELYPHHRPTELFLNSLIEERDAVGASAVLHTVIEPFGLGSLISARKGLTDPLAIDLFDRVAKDEAKHMSLLPAILSHSDLSDIEQNRLRHLIFTAIKTLSSSTIAEPVFARFWSKKWERDIWQHRALHSSYYAQQAKRVAALILNQIKKIWFLENDLETFKRALSDGFADLRKQQTSALIHEFKPRSRHPHYDDGNQMFVDMVGPSMAYSCANWDDTKSLDEAQENKFNRIAQFSGIDSDTRSVVDLGCGWGGYVGFLARKFPFLERLDGMTVSQQQADWFTENNQDRRAKTWRQSCFDYLESIQGANLYDAASSIEALEHFANARDYQSDCHRDIYRNFFRLVRGATTGKFGLETIVATASISDLPRNLARRALNFALFMLRDVYPDSHLASPVDIVAASEPFYQIEHLEVIHQDYAKTCQAWLENLERVAHKYEAERVKVYRKYLQLCIEQFESHSIGLLQASLVPRQTC